MFIDLIKKRRSIRQFKDKAVEKEKIDLLIEAALRSPSSRSLNPWEFVVITDKSTLYELSCSKPHGASFLKNAALGIAIIADFEKSDVWIEDTSIAATLLQMTAESLEIGSCWVQIRLRASSQEDVNSEDYIKQLLDIPENDDIKIASVIALGYPGEEKEPIPYDQLPQDVIIEV